jgi:hypothetical protein
MARSQANAAFGEPQEDVADDEQELGVDAGPHETHGDCGRDGDHHPPGE